MHSLGSGKVQAILFIFGRKPQPYTPCPLISLVGLYEDSGVCVASFALLLHEADTGRYRQQKELYNFGMVSVESINPCNLMLTLVLASANLLFFPAGSQEQNCPADVDRLEV